MSTPAQRLARHKFRLGDSWRDAIKGSFTQRTLWQGDATWTTETPYFRDVHDAHTLNRSIKHTGWFGDTTHQELLHVGVVARLTHGRFIAGYRNDDGGSYVWFDEVWTDERDAAYCADEHAQVAAEREDDYQQKWQEATRLDDLIEAKCADVMMCKSDLEDAILILRVAMSQTVRDRAQRNRAKARIEASEIITDIRALRIERAALNVET